MNKTLALLAAFGVVAFTAPSFADDAAPAAAKKETSATASATKAAPTAGAAKTAAPAPKSDEAPKN